MFTFIQTSQLQLIGFGWPGLPEMLIIAALFLLIFGGAKLPGLMRNLGRSVNEFKAGIKDPVDSDKLSDDRDEKDVRHQDAEKGEEVNS
jgi:sec-independent protein translocase protein TatA